jgi:hypothetical protein
MKFIHFVVLLIFGFVLLYTQNLARSVDIAASWGFVLSIVAFLLSMILPLIITGGGVFAGGHAGEFFGALFGGLAGALFSAIFFAIPIIFVIFACLGYHFINEWGISGFEDKSAGITGGVFLGISLLVSFLR